MFPILGSQGRSFLRLIAAVVLTGAVLWSGPIVANAEISDSLPASTKSGQQSWVPWDGFRITTKQKCENRRRYIVKTYSIPNSYLRCDHVNACPPNWLLMVRSDAKVIDLMDEAVVRVERSLPEERQLSYAQAC